MPKFVSFDAQADILPSACTHCIWSCQHHVAKGVLIPNGLGGLGYLMGFQYWHFALPQSIAS